jgi:hypothetical protein
MKSEVRLGAQFHSKAISFGNVLITTAGRKATDPKDKIFGLYGIFQALKMESPKPDYSKPVNEIYREATQAAIVHDRSANVINFVILFGNAENTSSWVPNWNGDAKAMGSMFIEPFCAAMNSVSTYRFSSDGKRLTLRGVYVDEVTIRTDPVVYPSGFWSSTNKNLNEDCIFKTVREWYHFIKHLNPYRTGQTALEAFFRTIIQDGSQTKDHTRNVERYRRPFYRWFPLIMRCGAQCESGGLADQGVSSLAATRALQTSPTAIFFHCHMIISLYVKVLFLTRTGYMGMAMRETQVGDLIVVLEGMKVPSLIRKKGESYLFIGPLYVHGIMDGEAWAELSTSIEEFTLI